jgi:hypothetical protein
MVKAEKAGMRCPHPSAFAVLRGGKGNRHCGHRSRGTYALTHLTPPKQRTVLFGKCGVRPSPQICGEGKGVLLWFVAG